MGKKQNECTSLPHRQVPRHWYHGRTSCETTKPNNGLAPESFIWKMMNKEEQEEEQNDTQKVTAEVNWRRRTWRKQVGKLRGFRGSRALQTRETDSCDPCNTSCYKHCINFSVFDLRLIHVYHGETSLDFRTILKCPFLLLSLWLYCD